jgi:hypothetical protein
MIDYGYGINNQFNVTNMFPALFVKTIIDKMFSDAGFTYQSSFFESDLFKRLIIPYNGGSSLKLTNQQVAERTIRVSRNSTQIITLNGVINNNIDGFPNYGQVISLPDKTTPPNNDAGNLWYDRAGGTDYNRFVVSKSGTYNLKFNFRLNVKHFPSTATATLTYDSVLLGNITITRNPPSLGSIYQTIANIPVRMKPTENIPDLDNVFNITATTGTTIGYTITSGTTSLTSTGELSITSFLNQNDIIEVKFYKTPGLQNTPASIYKSGTNKQNVSSTSYCEANILQDSFFAVSFADTTIQENDDVEVNSVLPDKIKQSDFFNSIIKAFNLFVDVDKNNTNKLLIEPRPIFYSSGVTNDWSQKLDYTKENKIIPLGELNSKTYKFTYKDDTDYFNTDYKTNFNEIYGERKYDILNDFLKGEVKTELIFSPTPLVDTIGHDRVIPKIYQLDSNGTIKPTQSNIRLLYWGGLKTTNNSWQHIATSGTTSRNDFPYAGHLDDVNNPTIDLNFGVPRQVYYTPIKYTANNLYNKYYRDYIEQISDKDSKLFTGYFLINEFDIQNLDFRDTFFFENEYWRLNKIIDYDRVNNQPTKCEFIKLKTLPPYVNDNGVTINGGVKDLNSQTPAPTSRVGTTFNNNHVTEGALVSGKNNIVSSGDGVIVIGNSNVVGAGSKNISITSSSGVNVLGGVSNISVTNSSGITVTESNVTYNNGIKTLNNVSYKKYVALLSQSGVTAPTVVELETTMSSGITSSYYLVGEYKLLSNAEFTANKTFVMINQTGLSMVGTQAIILANRIGNSEILIQVADTMGTGYMDNVLLDTQIEIRVYS